MPVVSATAGGVGPTAGRVGPLPVASAAAGRAREDELAPDRPVPSAAALVLEYGIAPRAVEVLRDEGLVITVPGRGAYVRPR